MPTLRGDIEFLKNKSKQALGAGRDFVAGSLADTRKSRTMQAVEFGLFNWLRVLGVIIITMFFLVIFSAWKSESGLWIVLLVFFLAYGLFFRGDEKRNGGVTGFLFNGLLGIFSALFAIVTGFFTGVVEILKNIFLGVADTGEGLVGWMLGIIKEVWMDMIALLVDILEMIKELIFDLFFTAREIVTEITVSLFTAAQEIVIDIAIGIVTAFREIITDVVTAISDAIREIWSSFIEMITDMVTFDKKES